MHFILNLIEIDVYIRSYDICNSLLSIASTLYGYVSSTFQENEKFFFSIVVQSRFY